MLEHFCECYFDVSGPILCPVLGSITPLFIPNSSIRPIRLIGLCVSLITFCIPYGLSLFFVILTTFDPYLHFKGWSGMRSFGKEYITAFLIREFLMIAVSCMLDPLLFYVLSKACQSLC
ncbi:hypothetical protein ZWY2020_036355 [Hordeum vulgare]|nr:hypothetical protein ZWY2020_036355 [Hordeum vulgare]